MLSFQGATVSPQEPTSVEPSCPMCLWLFSSFSQCFNQVHPWRCAGYSIQADKLPNITLQLKAQRVSSTHRTSEESVYSLKLSILCPTQRLLCSSLPFISSEHNGTCKISTNTLFPIITTPIWILQVQDHVKQNGH